MSFVPWDPSDDLPTSQLLRTTGWGPALVGRCQEAYDSLIAPGEEPLEGRVVSLLMDLGVHPPWLAHRCERAILRRGPSLLSFEELLVGLIALDPTTAHGGVWNGLRSQYIFRTYDADEDGWLTPPELAQMLADVRRLYGNPPTSREEALAEATSLAHELESEMSVATHLPPRSADEPALSLAAFRAAVGQLRVRGCSRLFRSDTPLFRAPMSPEAADSPRRGSDPALPTPGLADASSPETTHAGYAVDGWSSSSASAAPASSRLDSWSAPPGAVLGSDFAAAPPPFPEDALDDRFEIFAPPTRPLPPNGHGAAAGASANGGCCCPQSSRGASPKAPSSTAAALPAPMWPGPTPPVPVLGGGGGPVDSGGGASGVKVGRVVASGGGPSGGGSGSKVGKGSRGGRGRRGGSEQAPAASSPPGGSPGRASGPSIWKASSPGGTAVTPTVAAESVFPSETLKPLEPPNSIELQPAAEPVAAPAALPSRRGVPTPSLVVPRANVLAVSTPADLADDSDLSSFAAADGDGPPMSPISPMSPAGNGEVRFAIKKTILEHAPASDAGPRLVASPRRATSPTMLEGRGAGAVMQAGPRPNLASTYPPPQQGGGGCGGTGGSAVGVSSLSRQRSVAIDPSDAALQTRKVGMQVSAWLPPPSPAPGKDVAKRIRDALLLSHWSAAALVPGGLGEGSLEYLCTDAEIISMCRLCIERKCWATSSLVRLRTPLKLFGDIHGQFSDLQRFFAAYGSPNPYTGDIEYVSYLFLGDYVDRGKHSLECICLLLALKICHPTMVTLLRGNHEDPNVNAAYGFRAECMARCREGSAVWTAINRVFEWLPVAALVDDCVLCVHGGIGESLVSLKQLRALPRPVKIDLSKKSVLNEVLWSDPTDSDERLGVHPNVRGPNTVSYGPDRVRDFCEANNLKLVVRAHQCVQDGFEWCAHGRLLTVFSAPDYGARWTNDAAMLVLNRELHVFPKVLKSRGKRPSVANWVNDQKRPYTPPRTRPAQPATVAYDEVEDFLADDENGEGVGGAPPAAAQRARAAGSTRGAAGSVRKVLGEQLLESALSAAPAVSVSLHGSQSDEDELQAPLQPPHMQQPSDGIAFPIDDDDLMVEPASAPSALLAQQMADLLLS